jgi:GTP-binding protein EngB required for normal cell division
MPEYPIEIPPMPPTEALNDAQQRHLSVTCEYIDKLLCDIEHVLHQTASPSPFPRHIVDISPAQVRVLEDYIRRIRKQLLNSLAWQHMKPERPNIPATRSVLTNLAFIDIAIEELKPSYMRGSGSLATVAATELNGVVYELRAVCQSMESYLRQELGTNLEKRLGKLERAGHDVSLLQLIEEIASRHGLVEFRSRIATLASRMEDDDLQVALFGRVSCGKSSFLNALLGINALPIGVNPITAVPTKLRYGTRLQANIAYANGTAEVVSLDAFDGLITEQGNPGNSRNVASALIEVPSSRLKPGVTLVDTPGLGSLARQGAAETMAYLPSCDLALVLIDAGATLNDEDIGTLRLLYENGIPAVVLLSKADLLAEGDLHRVTGYIEEQLQHELGGSFHVHAVSALQEYAVLLNHFFEKELLPRFDQARALRSASLRRKIGALRESVMTALETLLQHKKRGEQKLISMDTQSAELKLRSVAGTVGEQQSALSQAFFHITGRPDAIISELAEMAATRICAGSMRHISSLELSEWTHDLVQMSVERVLSQSRDSLNEAIDTLQTIACALGRSDMPDHDDVNALLRDVPRFEIDVIPCKIEPALWKWFGKSLLQWHIRNGLNARVRQILRAELNRYGRALGLWSEQMTRKMQALLNSYADTYRAQLNRMRDATGDRAPSAGMENDFSLLLNWDAEEAADTAQERA